MPAPRSVTHSQIHTITHHTTPHTPLCTRPQRCLASVCLPRCCSHRHRITARGRLLPLFSLAVPHTECLSTSPSTFLSSRVKPVFSPFISCTIASSNATDSSQLRRVRCGRVRCGGAPSRSLPSRLLYTRLPGSFISSQCLVVSGDHCLLKHRGARQQDDQIPPSTCPARLLSQELTALLTLHFHLLLLSPQTKWCPHSSVNIARYSIPHLQLWTVINALCLDCTAHLSTLIYSHTQTEPTADGRHRYRQFQLWSERPAPSHRSSDEAGAAVGHAVTRKYGQ